MPRLIPGPTVSVAHMKSPPGWVEPGPRPEFDESTVVLHSTPAAEGAESIAVCLPAISPSAAHRDEA